MKRLIPMFAALGLAGTANAQLALDYVPAGVNSDTSHKDSIIFDIVPQGNGDAAPVAGQMSGVSASGFGHASCNGYSLAGNSTSAMFSNALPPNK